MIKLIFKVICLIKNEVIDLAITWKVLWNINLAGFIFFSELFLLFVFFHLTLFLFSSFGIL